MLLILLAGTIVYAVYVVWGDAKLESVRNGRWFVVYLLVMAAISYLGDSNFGGTNVIPFGWDILVVGVVALVFYYWGVRRGVTYPPRNRI